MSDPELPNNTEAERAFLGSVLLAPEIFNDFSSYIKPEDFYLRRHRHIWEVMRSLIEDGKHIDYLTLHDGLNSKGWLEEIGKDAYLIQMIEDTPTALHAESYARIIKDKSNKRRLLSYP
jgi:replicative DNA helicase